MLVNAVAPWEGTLHWVGQPTEGVSQTTGNPWKRVDFAVKYNDHQMQEKFIVFSMSGPEKVNRLLSTPLGTLIRVTWRPDANSYTGADGVLKWFPKCEAIGFVPVTQQQPAAPAQSSYPQQPQGAYPRQQYPPQGYPAQQPAYQPSYGAPQQPGRPEDLPDGF